MLPAGPGRTLTCFPRLDRTDRDTGRVGQLLLSHPGGFAVAADGLPVEGCILVVGAGELVS